MQMNAYSELYIDDAAEILGEYLDYMTNYIGYDSDEAMNIFAYSDVGHQFEIGNVKYVTGMSGIELANYVVKQVTGNWLDKCDDKELKIDRSKEYWAGWAIARYQWDKGCQFKYLIAKGISASKVIEAYILHEADFTKFIIWCDSIYNKEFGKSALKRFRRYAELTQKQLSEKSGVSLRMIQLYEQGQNDISKAGADVVIALSKVLCCRPEQLLND